MTTKAHPELPPATVLALDIGGTKVEAARVDIDAGRVLDRARLPTPRDTDGERVFAAVADVLGAVARGDEIACGVGTCGPMTSAAGHVSPVNMPAWVHFPLRSRVAEATGLPTRLDGDGKALALAEGRFGAARHSRSFVVVTVSTGVGGGVVVDGRLLHGAHANAGHIGHMVVVPDGRRCRCGAHGCLEAHASGWAIEELTGRPAAEANFGTRVETGRLVGRTAGALVTLLDLDLVVVTGSVALGFGEPFLTGAREALAESAVLPFARHATVVPSPLGADAALLGAAAVASPGGVRRTRGAAPS